MLPITVGETPSIASGEEVFNTLNEAEQKEILGKDKWDHWKAGDFTLADISGVSNDPIYGDMRVEKSLLELLKK